METKLLKLLQIKYPTISYTNKLYEGNKKNIVNANFTSENAKIAFQNQNFFLPAAGYKPCLLWEIIAKLLCHDNSNAELNSKLCNN